MPFILENLSFHLFGERGITRAKLDAWMAEEKGVVGREPFYSTRGKDQVRDSAMDEMKAREK